MAEETQLAKAAGVTNVARATHPPSFNPPQEAFCTFTRSGMDVLVFGNHVIDTTEGLTPRS